MNRPDKYEKEVIFDEKKKNSLEALRPNVYTLMLNKEKTEASEVIVGYIKTYEKIYTTRDDDNSEVWVYSEGVYIPEGRTYIREIVRYILNKAYTTYFCNQVIAKIEVDTYIKQEDFFQEEDINLICLKNGIYDIKNKKLIKHSSEYRFFQKLPVEYVTELDCPNIKKFLSEILKEDIEVIQELFGFLLLRDYKFEKAVMLIGNGRNGKSKLIELVKHFLGANNCCNISLEALENDQFALGEFFGKLANLSADISKTALKHTGNFKSLTGHDLISASRKFKTRINYVNYAKLIFAANELPLSYDLSFAFFNRWILVEFPYTFIDKSEYDKLEDKTKHKIADKEIINKISTKEELNGLFNWALLGLYRLLKNNQFSYSNTTEQTKNKWQRKAESFKAFCMDCIKEDFDGEIEKTELKKHYVTYCKKHDIKKLSSDKIIKHILTMDYGSIECRANIEGRPRIWKGVAIKDVQVVHETHSIPTICKSVQFPIGVKNKGKLDTLDRFQNI